LRMRRDRRFARHNELVRSARIGDAKHSPDVIGVAPILQKEGELNRIKSLAPM
jgi:hypothetical protein